MQKRIYSLLTLFLAAVMLTSASGIVVGKMICLKSGRELIKINCVEDHCCPEDENTETATVESNCCLFQGYSIVTDQFLQSQQILLKAPVWISAPVNNFYSYTPELVAVPETVQLCSKPPPRTSRAVLQFHQTFLI
ncbi:MAG: hypothetical protein ACRC3B_14715 [Bacteroidia bacterium]